MAIRSLSPGVVCFLATLTINQFIYAGDLTPPAGPVAPTMKTLDEIEPRTPIGSLPFTINQPGSYYLTGNLMGSGGSNGISITTSDVTIDLRGFRLMGVEGALDGINTSGALTNIVITNGALSAWPGDGIDTSSSSFATIDAVHAADSGEAGIRSGASSTISRCQVRGAAAGIVANTGDNRITDCTVGPTTGAGITAGDRAVISGCAATGNGDVGISVANDAVVSNCTAKSNASYGIITQTGCTLSACTAEGNTLDGINLGNGGSLSNCTARSNLDDGFSISANCTVSGCTALSNSDVGITTGTGCSITGCVASLNGIDANATGRHGITLAVGCLATHCTARVNQGSGIVATDACSILSSNSSGNRADGILVANDCKVINNNVDGNGATSGDGAGIHSTGVDNRIEGNNATDNDRGIDVDAAGSLIIRNSASGNAGAMNYKIEAGNAVGEILNVDAMTITASNPWANFEY